MKKLWERYSYVIILVAICYIAVFALFNRLDKEEFVNVTIEEGETLWEISEKFSDSHTLSSEQFVHWVEKKNGIVGDKIFPGDKLVIPVQADTNTEIEVVVLAGQ